MSFPTRTIVICTIPNMQPWQKNTLLQFLQNSNYLGYTYGLPHEPSCFEMLLQLCFLLLARTIFQYYVSEKRIVLLLSNSAHCQIAQMLRYGAR